jgi:hypothetical protein
VKRGRGWVISADAVAAWARGVSNETAGAARLQRVRARGVSNDTRRPGPMARGLGR